MNIQRFTAPTSREALAKARAVFGDSTLILSNRQTEQGVEVMATAEDTLASLDEGGAHTGSGNRQQQAPSYREIASQVEEDANQLAMSTLSFQDYVRERMARRRQEETVPVAKAAAKPQRALATETPIAVPRRNLPMAPEMPQRPVVSTPAPRKSAAAVAAPSTPAVAPQGIVDELHAMKEMIEERFNTLAWLGQAKQNPVQSSMMMKMIRAGYSPALSRAILERLPQGLDAQESMRWVIDVLERNLRTDANLPPLYEQGGVFALIGATGVGKTTTAAKLAGLCSQVYGPASVGLITLDTYRVGAHEQLRAYGKMMGVVAHLAHDKAALQDLLGLLSNKKMVLVDTTGIAPRDPRKRDMLDLLDLPDVKRILVVNAGGHGDTLDEAITCFKTGNQQDAILSKTDEAVKLGPAIDAAIRHQLTLRGITTGQRVPEDWETAVAARLVRMSMRNTASSAFDPKVADLNFFFGQSASSSHETQGAFHA